MLKSAIRLVICSTVLLFGSVTWAQTAFINEIHYDNVGADVGEAVEIAGQAGTNLSGWSIVLYNGSGGASYGTISLGGVIPDQCSGIGTLFFQFQGIQNGPPDGLALVDPSSSVVEFLSYEGTLTATAGPATGMMSTDLGFSESGVTPIGHSLQRAGMATWSSPAANTFGSCNASQYSPSGSPTIVATKRDSLFDSDMDGEANPGDTLKYIIVIKNTGNATADSVVFMDTIDPNTDSLTVTSTPVAVNDNYSSTGNVGITVPAGSGVLGNDSDPDGTGLATPPISAFDASSANSGTVSMTTSDGSFTYDPPPGFEGTDTFTYTIDDDEGNTDVATVTITVTDMIWFIDNSVSGGGNDGTLADPFESLADFETANGGGGAADPEAGDNIFIYETMSGDYAGGVTLEDDQVAIGQGATASIETITGITLPANSNSLPTTSGSHPNIVDAAGDGITLAEDNTIRGLNVGNTPSFDGIKGSSVGTLTISEVAVTGAGGAIDITTGTLTVTLDSVESKDAPGDGILLETVGGTFDVTGTATIDDPTDDGIEIKTSSGTFTFASVDIDSAGGNGIELTTNTDSVNVNGGTIGASEQAAADGVNISGGSGAVNIAASITNTSSNAVEVSSRTAETVTFSGAIDEDGAGILLTTNTGSTINFTGGLDIDTGTSAGFTATGGGTVNVTGSANTITTTTGTGVTITSTTIGATGVTFKSIDVDGATNGISLSSTGSTGGSFTVTGTGTTDGSGGTIENTTGDGVLLSTVRNVTLKNMIIGDATATTAEAADATTNIGDDGIDMTSVKPAGSDSVGLRLDNVMIARTEDHGINGEGGDNDGLILNDCEILNAGDAIDEHAINFGSGFTGQDTQIKGIVRIDDSVFDAMAQHGITLENADSDTLNMTVTNSTFSDNDATLLCSGSTCEGSGIQLIADGSQTGGTTDDPVINLVVDNCEFNNIDLDGIDLIADPGGTIDTDILNSTFDQPEGDDAIDLDSGSLDGDDDAKLTFDIKDIMVTRMKGTLIRIKAANKMEGRIVVDDLTENILDGGGVNALGARGIEIIADGDASEIPDVDILIEDTRIIDIDGDGIQVTGRDVTSTATMDFTVNRSVVGTSADPVGGEGIEARARDDFDFKLEIDSTSVFTDGTEGIDIDSEDSSVFNATITNSSGIVGDGGGTADEEIDVDNEDAGSSLCSDISGNTLDGGSGHIRVAESAGTHNVVQDDKTTAVTGIHAVNGIPSANVTVVGTPIFGVVGSCTKPSLPTNP